MGSDESSMTCHRCDMVFEAKKELILHWKSAIPCDFICCDCGMRLQNRTAFYKHRDEKRKCKYIPKDDIQDKIFESNRTINRCAIAKELKKCTVRQITNINTNTINGDINNININIDMRGMILKHTDEMKLDKEQLLGDIVEKILFRMDTGLSGKANWGTMAFTDSFHQMFTHIYGNKRRPECHNLLLKDETTRELQIYNGEEFVDDKLTSEERMLKVLNFMGDGLRWMVENCDNYTDEDKEAKRDKIGRVISGIPRFKMTYKAMFDNIFKTLKDVREDIIKDMESVKMIKK